MDNPSQESSLSTFEASNEFANIFGGEQTEEKKEAPANDEDAALELVKSEEGGEESPEADAEQDEPADDAITVEVDGKPVVLTKAQIAEAHKGQLRQDDYTRKTMAVAEEAKAAKAEREAAAVERQQYATQLGEFQKQLQGVLNEQSNIDWQQLLETDPVEYLKQQHLYQQRQATLTQAQAEQEKIEQQQQAESEKTRAEYIRNQHQLLVDKLPEWKDEAKRKEGVAALAKTLLDRGFTQEELSKLSDHRLVLEFNDAKKYRELMARAKESAKKVQALPTKVERPGNGQASKVDGRTAAVQRLSKSGSQQDAAEVFAQMFS
jgi:hypothetical protein